MYFCDFSRYFASTRILSKFNFIKISWLQKDWNKAWNIDQAVRALLAQN